MPADIIPAAERPDGEFPFVLITGRQLEHWHTGAMTRRAGVLDAIEPEPTALMHPLDLDAIGARAGDVITVESRRGIISLYARADDGTPRGSVFIPFCFYEAAANLLTNPALDPVGKIPEFKYCAVKVMRGGELTPRSSYGGGQALRRARDLINNKVLIRKKDAAPCRYPISKSPRRRRCSASRSLRKSWAYPKTRSSRTATTRPRYRSNTWTA